ncbi:MAG: hypothetical protein QG629_630 [Patescibacteria group bacterium]|nr:hypothetical protein [Candidatus Saccharibacteria bacterium]MDQ5963548.1 hypothetical protein [Patescibacteria group bacterium]
MPFGSKPNRDLARWAWLAARARADFALVITEPNLQLTADQAATIYDAFDELVDDFDDYVTTGLIGECAAEREPGYIPPLLEEISDKTEALIDELNGDDTSDVLSYGMLQGSEVLRELTQRRTTIKKPIQTR